MRSRLGPAALVVALGLGGCGGGDTSDQPRIFGDRATTSDRGGEPPALTLRQSIGQHFVFAYSGLRPPEALERRIARGEAAGVVLFSRNVRSTAQVRATVTRLQRIERPAAVDTPLLVMVDQEGGTVRRIPGAPAASAAQTGNADAARRNGAAAARTLRAAGVTVDFAPVADVARPGAALEREGRTYGRDAATVAQRAGAFAEGLRDGGVESVLKHYPGFGAATINTDDGAARVDLPLSALRRIDAAPYAKLKPRAVMLSTAIYPRVDPRPAAFARRWVTGELRGRLKFGGVAVTDDLQAAAVASFGTPSQLAFYALRAGVDLPLFAQTYEAGARAAAGLEQAVRSGALPRKALDASTARVLTWRTAIAKGAG
ncbi:MAG TPA: glycoside hydrolase family 3 N-terminal domain-containing protein [Baekduia sp.]|uniref:glycoside hydrolase family 3 N-terminal domain-containing protein n=1 Tax=Baekduia sp. TaxID=2600305 RepID=UPI002BA8F24E|nr:glycoside hydrolase family 3 N-terminal domain-containing protein [Baekduia sp.]HMJ37399.1 glycoside hydrolase family 3 N-terminal domain-containing protein [Baekduia sp.]